MIARTKSGRPSRRRMAEDWNAYFCQIERGETVEIKRPPHLTIYETRDRILKIAKNRQLSIDYQIILRHLDVWKV